MSVDPEDRVCGELDQQPEMTLELWAAYFANYFPLDSETCDKVSAIFVGACGQAVQEAAKCQTKALKGVRKGAKRICKAQGGNDLDDACNSDVKQVIEQDGASIEAEAAAANTDCVGEIADDFMDLCRGVD